MIVSKTSDSDEDYDVMTEVTIDAQNRELAKSIIQDNANSIGTNLHKFWLNNQQRLKQAVSGKQAGNHTNSGQTIKD